MTLAVALPDLPRDKLAAWRCVLTAALLKIKDTLLKHTTARSSATRFRSLPRSSMLRPTNRSRVILPSVTRSFIFKIERGYHKDHSKKITKRGWTDNL